MGSKARFAKDILPIVLNDRKQGQWYVEPFAGGMNTLCLVDGNRIASDNNKYLIAMWNGLCAGVEYPTIITKEFYSDVRDCFNGKNENYSDFLVGWIGFMGSANGRFFEGGYSGKSNTKIGTVRDYIDESIRNIQKQLPTTIGVSFVHSDYMELQIPKNSVVYCDIPYANTKQYATSKGFNHSIFWGWVRDMSKQGHNVFISEYDAPDDFECVWSKEVGSSLSANGEIGGRKKSVEKLFKLIEF